MELPGALERTIIAMHGAAGRAWLDDLSRRVADYERRWDLQMSPPFDNLSFNYAAPGLRRDGTPVVLKISFGAKEIVPEVAALRLAQGNGMVRVLEEDPDGHAFLMQRAVPGDLLTDHPDDESATRIAAGVMVALWRPPPLEHPFPTVAAWGRGFARMRARFSGGTGPLPAELTGRAERLYAELVATSASPVVLHGDLHHHNILRSGDRWLAIDPKGLVGEPAYEIGALMRNRLPPLGDEVAARVILDRRIALVADTTGLDADRMRRWTVAQALLSAWWTVEDGGDIADARDVIRTSEILVRDSD